MAILVDDVHWAPCDRIARHEDQLGDVTVRQALCRQPCHPELSRRQRVDAGDRRRRGRAPAAINPSRSSASSPVAPPRRTRSRPVSKWLRALTRWPARLSTRPRAGGLKFCLCFFESADGLLQRLERFVSRFGECTTSQRNA